MINEGKTATLCRFNNLFSIAFKSFQQRQSNQTFWFITLVCILYNMEANKHQRLVKIFQLILYEKKCKGEQIMQM